MSWLFFLGLEKRFEIFDPKFAPYFEKSQGVYQLRIEGRTKVVDGQRFIGPCLVFWNKRNSLFFQKVVKEITVEQATEARSFDDLFSNPKWIQQGIHPQTLSFHPKHLELTITQSLEDHHQTPQFHQNIQKTQSFSFLKNNGLNIQLPFDKLEEKFKNAKV